jgi:formate-dependent nitrite reductase cytochrome c552 subunit
MKTIVPVLIGVCLFVFFAYGEAGRIENSCVRCHQNLPATAFIGAKYQDWNGSIHAKEGVTCDRCHGGDPAVGEKEAAHRGVYNSSRPESRIFYKNVPGTCGACHRRDFNAFKSSVHYAYLEQTGAGPTCVTCHESHAMRIISPRQIPATCEECHNRRMRIAPEVPAEAQAILLLMNETGLLLRCAKEKIGGSDREKSQEWKDANATIEKVRDEWHAFDLRRVQSKILEAYDQVKAFVTQ